MTRSRREQALALAAIGLKIFPLARLSKEPRADVSWTAIRTSEAAIIDAWFDEDPDMNYGVSGGDAFLIVDGDEKDGKEGITHFTELNLEQPPDDWCLETFTVRSPSGGKHWYLRTPHPVGNSNKGFPSGIDIRGANGYVVGPGCLTDERKNHKGRIYQYAGPYEIELETELQQAPQWLIDRCLRHFDVQAEDTKAIIELDLPANVDRAREFLATRAPAIEGNNGDDWTFQTIAKVKDCGVSEDTALGLLLEPGGWNVRCIPPWDTSELSTKVKNVYRYGQNRAGNKSDLFDAPGAFTTEELMLQGMAEKREAKRQGLEELLYGPERILNSREHREMIIPEWLPGYGIVAMLAKRSVGKTVQMMDMACRIATNRPWHDLPIIEDFVSIYVCGEDDIGARDQFRAWVKKYEVCPSESRFMFMAGTFDLLSAENVELWARFLVDRLNGQRAVLFVDTWQRSTSRGAQNDDTDMQTAIAHAEALGRSFRGPAVVAFHPPKNDASIVLGSSVIENSTQAIWTLTAETEGRRMEVTRIKGPGYGNYQVFRYDSVELGAKDAFGRELTGLVPSRIAGTTTSKSSADRERVDALRLAFATAIKEQIIAAQRGEDWEKLSKTAFGFTDTATRLVGMEGHAALDELDLTNAPAIEQTLRKLFDNGNSGVFEFGDGGKLVLDRTAARPKFKLTQ